MELPHHLGLLAAGIGDDTVRPDQDLIDRIGTPFGIHRHLDGGRYQIALADQVFRRQHQPRGQIDFSAESESQPPESVVVGVMGDSIEIGRLDRLDGGDPIRIFIGY